MDKVRMALVGCGGMGTRHLHGLKQLAGTAFDSIDLVAVCDINPDNAAMAALGWERLDAGHTAGLEIDVNPGLIRR